MKIQESGENYLETILFIKERKGSVRSVDIVDELSYSKSSVSRGVNILKENGYITIDDGEINFTSKGFKKAKSIIERHNTLTKCFIDMGVDPKIAEEDACKVEHDISDQTFNAIKKHLKN